VFAASRCYKTQSNCGFVPDIIWRDSDRVTEGRINGREEESLDQEVDGQTSDGEIGTQADDRQAGGTHAGEARRKCPHQGEVERQQEVSSQAHQQHREARRPGAGQARSGEARDERQSRRLVEELRLEGLLVIIKGVQFLEELELPQGLDGAGREPTGCAPRGASSQQHAGPRAYERRDQHGQRLWDRNRVGIVELDGQR
jgi:hypothetical protein